MNEVLHKRCLVPPQGYQRRWNKSVAQQQLNPASGQTSSAHPRHPPAALTQASLLQPAP